MRERHPEKPGVYRVVDPASGRTLDVWQDELDAALRNAGSQARRYVTSKFPHPAAEAIADYQAVGRLQVWECALAFREAEGVPFLARCRHKVNFRLQDQAREDDHLSRDERKALRRRGGETPPELRAPALFSELIGDRQDDGDEERPDRREEWDFPDLAGLLEPESAITGRRDLMSAFSTLTPDERRVLYLRHVAGLTLVQTAIAMGRPPRKGWAWWTERRAMAKVRAALGIEVGR